MSSRRQELEELERGLLCEEYRRFLVRLRATAPTLARFEDWGQVVALLRAEAREDDKTDPVLRSILSAWRESRESLYAEVLLAAFWPTLEAIFWLKRSWEADGEERWQGLTCAFLQAVCRLDPNAAPCGLARSIRNRTIHYFHDQCRRRWRSGAHEKARAPEELNLIAQGVACERQEQEDAKEDCPPARSFLDAHYRAGALNQDDYLLLLATRIGGESVAGYARRHGLDYQVLKKRRQRAEAALAHLQKNLSGFCPHAL